jgi:hypothetical protein
MPGWTEDSMPRPFEARDEQERAAIRAIVEQLPEDHPAREAYEAGADAIELTNLVGREDLVEKLTQAWFDWYARMLQRQGRSAQS